LLTPARTSSIEQADTVDKQKGMPASSAACAACTSPRRAFNPAMPTGDKPSGSENFWPNSVVSVDMLETLRKTRWRRAICCRSDWLLRRVVSLKAPPSMYSNKKCGKRLRARVR